MWPHVQPYLEPLGIFNKAKSEGFLPYQPAPISNFTDCSELTKFLNCLAD